MTDPASLEVMLFALLVGALGFTLGYRKGWVNHSRARSRSRRRY